MKKLLLTAAAAAMVSLVQAQPLPSGERSLDVITGQFEVAGVPTDPIFDAPDGVKTIYTRESKGFYPRTTSTWLPYNDAGSVVEKIVTPSGKIFLSNPLPSLNCKSYLTADEDAEGNILIKFPQSIYQKDGTNYSALVMKPLDADRYSYMPADEADQVYVLKKDGDSYSSVNKDLIITLVRMADTEDITKVDWFGYSVRDITMKLFTREAVTLPEGAPEPQPWSFISEYTGHKINAVTIGDDIWLQGVARNYPEGWIKGTINDDAIKFEGPQYLGIDSEEQHFVFVNTMTFKTTPNGDGTFTMAYTFTPFSNFNYNATDKHITADDGKGFYICSTPSGDVTMTYDIFRAPRMQPQDRDVTTPPAAPVFWRVAPYSSENGYGSIRVWIPNYDVKGNIIDTKDLYWNLIVDGEPYEFNPDTFPYLPKAMTDIPYGFTTGNDIYFRQELTMGTYTLIFYPFEGWDTLGMRSVYINGDTRVESETTTCTPDNLPGYGSVDDIDASAEPVATFYYDLAGVRADNPVRGIYIRVEKMSDGRTRTSKVVLN